MPRQNTRKKIQSLISIDGLLERIGIRKKESVGIAFGGGRRERVLAYRCADGLNEGRNIS